MKWIPIVLFVAALGCKKDEKQAVQQTVQDMRSGNTAPAGYVQDLQQDLKKAEDAAAKANAAIQQTSEESAKALQEAGQ
ncbi:MAG: hypothetical protein WC728_00395 [Elusimicrobiota bacterium]